MVGNVFFRFGKVAPLLTPLMLMVYKYIVGYVLPCLRKMLVYGVIVNTGYAQMVFFDDGDERYFTNFGIFNILTNFISVSVIHYSITEYREYCAARMSIIRFE